MCHYTFFPGTNESYRQQTFSLQSARDGCGSNASERARFCVGLQLLFVIFCFLFVYVVLAFKLKTYNFKYKGLSLTIN
jgi:hypothetical protein